MALIDSYLVKWAESTAKLVNQGVITQEQIANLPAKYRPIYEQYGKPLEK